MKKRKALKAALELCTVGKALGVFTVSIVQTKHAVSFSSSDMIVLICVFTEQSCVFAGKTRRRVPLICEVLQFTIPMRQQTV